MREPQLVRTPRAVDGRQVVRDGEVLTLDHRDAGRRLNAGQKKALAGVADRDWAGRSADEAFPLSLEINESLEVG